MVPRYVRVFIPCLLLLATASAGSAQTRFDHSPFGALLRRHVHDGFVDYQAFRQAPEFAVYLDALARFDPAVLGRDDRLAFWINAYNAYTIALILKHNETESIRNINKSLGIFKGLGPWNERIAVIDGRAYGLDHIEQKIIRPEFREPRIHFALVCAAIGCPPLRTEAYVGDRLDAQLDDQARIFLVETPEKNRVDVENRRVFVSEVFRFRDYENDFGGNDAAIGRYIAQFWPAGPERDVLESGAFELSYTHYDWTLNSVEQRGR